MSAVYTAEQLGELWDCSTWAIYQAARRGDCPVAPIRVGRRLVWPRAQVDALLGLTTENSGTPVVTTGAPSSASSTDLPPVAREGSHAQLT